MLENGVYPSVYLSVDWALSTAYRLGSVYLIGVYQIGKDMEKFSRGWLSTVVFKRRIKGDQDL